MIVPTENATLVSPGNCYGCHVSSAPVELRISSLGLHVSKWFHNFGICKGCSGMKTSWVPKV